LSLVSCLFSTLFFHLVLQIHQALENQLQQRIDSELAFFFEVDFADQPDTILEPFLFFQGEVVDAAVISYLSGHPALATQEAYDMLVQACWNRLSPSEEVLNKMGRPEEQPMWLVEQDEDGRKEKDESFTFEQHANEVFSSNEDSAFFHCSEYFGSAYDPQFLSCVQELWHGYGAMVVYDESAVETQREVSTTTTTTQDDVTAAGYDFAVQLEQCSAKTDTCSADNDSELRENGGADGKEDFGSPAFTTMPAAESKDTLFTWSMFFMLCSVATIAAFYVVMKMKDEEYEQVIVEELEILRRGGSGDYDVQLYQAAYATDDDDEEEVVEKVEKEEAPYKENVVTEVLVKATTKGARARRSTRTFGSSLHNR
jgi:hypothetical protein